MYYSNALIDKMARDKFLALKLEKALFGVKEQVIENAERIQDGATRLIYYTSCFTENYQDVCARLKNEDLRFFKALYQLIKERKIISDIVYTYIELLLKHKTQQQLEYIYQLLIKCGVNISTQTITIRSLSLGVTTAICLGSKVSSVVTKKIGRRSDLFTLSVGFYGYVQEASERAMRLQVMHPAYYQALYFRKLEMMYFLVEPVFMNADAFRNKTLSDNEIANTITRMVR